MPTHVNQTNTDLMNLVSREELDARFPPPPCGHPTRITPACHPGAAVRMAYSQGMLAVFCFVCELPVFTVVIGARYPKN